ncbi:MAG: hypothetical protein ACRCZ0_11800 [Cetobacterium sp.]
MLKIDKVEQSVRGEFTSKVVDRDYTLSPMSGTEAILKTNIGKTTNFGFNLGAEPYEVEVCVNTIRDFLGVEFMENKSIEYCLDVRTDFKLVDNKHILKTFLKALEVHNYRSGKVDFKIEKEKWIDKAELKGMKGYKKSRAIKIYSKFEEKGMEEIGDLIRIELILNARALEQNKIKKIDDTDKARKELKEFLDTMRATIVRANQHSKITINLIEMFQEELLN